jgi:hypothetical protein
VRDANRLACRSVTSLAEESTREYEGRGIGNAAMSGWACRGKLDSFWLEAGTVVGDGRLL